MAPVVLAANLLEVGHEALSHALNSVGHDFDFLKCYFEFTIPSYFVPKLLELWATEDSIDNSGTCNGWVRVHRSDDHLQLRKNSLLFISIAADETQSTNSLTVETKVLSEGLSNNNWKTSFSEKSNSVVILLTVTTGIALISHIEENDKVLLFADVKDTLPLIISGVTT